MVRQAPIKALPGLKRLWDELEAAQAADDVRRRRYGHLHDMGVVAGLPVAIEHPTMIKDRDVEVDRATICPAK
jgi:hypothetical protein